MSAPPGVSAAVARGVGLCTLTDPLRSPRFVSERLVLAPEFAHPALQDEEEALLSAGRAVELELELAPVPREPAAAKEEYYDEVTGRCLPADLVRAARREQVNCMLDWKTWE